MKKRFVVASLFAAVSLLIGGCEPNEKDQFKSNFEDAVKAAEQGKDLVKSPAKKK